MVAVNSKTTAKKKGKPRGKPFSKNNPSTGEIDNRINREGAPPRGASAKEIYDYYDGLTPKQIVESLPHGFLRKMYQDMPQDILLKHLKALRINAAIMFDPTPGLVNLVQDRTDGKVPETINHAGTLKVPGLHEALKTIYGNRSTTD